MISRILRTFAPVALAFTTVSLITPLQLHAQAAPSLVTTRLTQPIDENVLVTFRGTVHPLANPANDRGAAPDSMPLDRIQVILKRSPVQESALQQLIHDEHTPGTASYHKWLTPGQFAQQFGPSDQDVATLEAWLESKGFNVEKINAGKQTIEISGNVAQFRNAFHAQIHKYMVEGQTHYANSTDPQIPAALAPVFGGFASLNNFQLKHFSHLLGKATYDAKTNRATPQWTYGTSTAVTFVLAPSDFAVQYDLPAAASGIDGTGQTIAIVNESNINIALVNQFRSLFGLPPNPPQVIIDGNDPGVDGINNPDGENGASTEAYLDVEWAGAVAPKATIDFVIGADTALESGLILAAEHAVYGNIAPVLSLSFGACEQDLGSGNTFLSNLWEQAAAQGITVAVSTGDSGSASCDNDQTQYYAVNGLAVSGYASTPYNVAVGGTDFYYSDYATGAASIATYWNTAASQTPSTSIIKAPIPEQPWNDSQYGLNAEDFYTQNGSSATTIAGGGGGASSAAVCSTSYNSSGTCAGTLSGYPKPAWQTGTGVPADKVRDIPDVSLFSADGWNYSYYPICAGDGDCQTPSGGNLVQITGVGGTSAAAPSFAGIMALVNQEYGRQGQAGFVLYPLAAQFPAAFHDVTVGTNAEPCAFSSTSSSLTLPTPNCNSVPNPITVTDPNLGAATEGELAGYSATAGYDTATGLGSVDASVLISDWGSVKFTSTNVTLTPSETSFAHGTAISINGSVAPTSGSGTATGTVALMTDSTEPVQQGQTNFPLTNGSFSASGVNYLPGGTYNIWGQYSGDATNAAAPSQKTQITVNPEASGIYFTVSNVATGYGGGPAVSSGAMNVPYGTQLMLSAQVAPSSQLTAYENCQTGVSATCPKFSEPTGTVVFADNAAAINTAVINAEGDAEYNAPWAIGSHSVTASYSGDSSYNASTAPAFTFTIAKNQPTMNLFSSVVTQFLPTGQSNVLTIQVLNSANATGEAGGLLYSNPAAAPTGTVSVSGLPSGSPTSATLAAGVDPQTASPAGIATIVIPSTVSSGTYNVTVTYNGDANYTTATQAAQIPAQSAGLTASTTAATITGTISPTTFVTISGTVTGKSGSPAPSNTGGGVLIYAGGYYLQEINVAPGTGDTSTFSTVLNSRSLLQGSNTITVQYAGDNTYAPSSVTLTTPISNPLSDFSMVPNSTIVPVTVGTPATDTIQLASVNGFAGIVTYSCTAASGITCTLTPSSNTFVTGGTATMALTLDASSSAANGANNVLITGTDSSGLFVHTLAINADVSGSSSLPSVGFALNVSPTAISLAPGSSTTAPGLSVMPSGGFTGPVALTATLTSPSGATSPPTVAINPATIQVTGASAISAGLSITTTSSTTVGTYTVDFTGTYSSGGVNITAGTNTPLTIIVTNVTPKSFTLSNSANITIASPGSGGTSTLTVTPAGGFTGAVAFTCAVTTSPAGAVNAPACSAPSAMVSSGNATATLTVATTPASTSAVHHPLDKFFVAGGGMVFAGLLFFGIPSRRRSWRSILAILLFAGIVGLGIGCGGSSGGGGGGGGGSAGTTTGAYVLTVTGTSGSLTASTTVSLTVN